MQWKTAVRILAASPVVVFAAHGEAKSLLPECRCVHGQDCWPSDNEWQVFNWTLDGQLIKTEPVAISCYPGAEGDLDRCAYVNEMWPDQEFQTSLPVGRPYPYNITCPPVDYASGETPESCTLGSLPTYAVNATSPRHIRAALHFAALRNVRLAVAGTGHDLNGRSDGYSSLEIWLRHFRNGIRFQDVYASETGCCRSGWHGSAIKVDGAYQWRDVNTVARENNVIVVGGGSVSPGVIGGWASGGGHGPASRNYGLGADQILEAEVMLADGRVVVANHCENTDLFRAMRGGGPGYGVTLSSTIKAYPNVDVVTAHHLSMAPLHKTELNADLLDAVAVLMQSYPDLSDAGYAGYGYWFRNFATVFVNNATSGYTHGFWTIGKGEEEARKAWAPVREKLAHFEDKLSMTESFVTYSDYWSFYEAESAVDDPTGTTSITTSRLMDRPSVSNYKRVRDTVEVISGKPENYDTNVILLVSGGQVFEDAKDPASGLNPAWRKSNYAVVSSSSSIGLNATHEERRAAEHEVTHVKGAATRKLAPGTGSYMNEGDRNEPHFQKEFYGSMYGKHRKVKQKYDPFGLFYCPTCVGSDDYVAQPDGPLCRA